MDDSVDPPEFDEELIDAEKSAVDVPEEPGQPGSASQTTPKRSSVNRCFLLATLLGLILIAILVTAAVLLICNEPVNRKLKDTTAVEEIYTEHEVNTAQAMGQMMDHSVEPCNNFYSYACGGWMNSVPGNSQTKTSIPHQQDEKNINKFRELMSKPAAAGDPAYKRKPREFFATCNNTAKRKQQGNTPFFNLVKSVGMFPILTKSWNEGNFKLQDVLTKLAKLNVQPLFEVSIDADGDLRNPRFVITRPTLLSEWQPFTDGLHPAYIAWTEDILKALGVDAGQDQEMDDLEDAFAVESLVLNINQSEIVPDDSIPHELTLAQLESHIHQLNWVKYLQDITAGAHGINKTITLWTPVVVETGYDLLPSLKKILDGSKKALANYLMKSLLPFTNFLYPPTRVFKGDFLPVPKPSLDFQNCHALTLGYFDLQVSRIYFDEIVNKSNMPFIHEMMNDIKGSIRSGVEQTSWLSPDYKKKVISRVTAEEDVVIPGILGKDDILNHMHDSIPTGDYFEFFTALARYLFTRRMNRARNESAPVTISLPDPSRPEMYIQSLEAAREKIDLTNKRSIIFATSGLQKGLNIVKSLLSSLGAEVQNSNLFALYFCLGKFFPESVQVSQLSYASLNINDSVALRNTFKAYQAFSKRHQERPLPELGLNNDQLFFLSFTQSFCEWLPGYKDDPFSLQRSVLGTLINSAEFADTFQCKKGSPMNPGTKCKIL